MSRPMEQALDGAASRPKPQIHHSRRHAIQQWFLHARSALKSSWPARIGLAIAIGMISLFGSYAIFNHQLDHPQESNNQRSSRPSSIVPAHFPNENFQPSEIGRYVVDAFDEGVVLEVGGTPMRRLRYQIMDVYVWQDQTKRTTFQLNIPREERLIIPVSTF